MKPGNCCSRGVQKVARTLQDLLTIPTPQIVVAQHHNGGPGQIRPEYALAARIERIAVDQGEDWLTGHGRAHCSEPRPKSVDRQLPTHAWADKRDFPTAGSPRRRVGTSACTRVLR